MKLRSTFTLFSTPLAHLHDLLPCGKVEIEPFREAIQENILCRCRTRSHFTPSVVALLLGAAQSEVL